jgi:hypothetical protein
MYPDSYKKGYSNFFEGILRASNEKVLFRGAVASGVSYGMLNCSMSTVYDFLKEHFYYFFGPTLWLRPLILLPTAYVGVCCYLPFDNVKVRLHTMRQLPNGQLPYEGSLDCFSKVMNNKIDSKI